MIIVFHLFLVYCFLSFVMVSFNHQRQLMINAKLKNDLLVIGAIYCYYRNDSYVFQCGFPRQAAKWPLIYET